MPIWNTCAAARISNPTASLEQSLPAKAWPISSVQRAVRLCTASARHTRDIVFSVLGQWMILTYMKPSWGRGLSSIRRIGLGGYAVWRVLGRSEGRLIVREERLRVRFELSKRDVSINTRSAVGAVNLWVYQVEHCRWSEIFKVCYEYTTNPATVVNVSGIRNNLREQRRSNPALPPGLSGNTVGWYAIFINQWSYDCTRLG
jgi:hypothetical protein